MSQFQFSPPDEILKELNNLKNEAPDTMKEMVEAGMDVMHKAILAKAPKKTGGTKGSLQKSGGHVDGDGTWYANNHFIGYDGKATKKKSKGTAYALKALAAEYGTPTQPAKPFLRPAMKAAEQEAYQAMQDVYDRRAKK